MIKSSKDKEDDKTVQKEAHRVATSTSATARIATRPLRSLLPRVKESQPLVWIDTATVFDTVLNGFPASPLSPSAPVASLKIAPVGAGESTSVIILVEDDGRVEGAGEPTGMKIVAVGVAEVDNECMEESRPEEEDGGVTRNACSGVEILSTGDTLVIIFISNVGDSGDTERERRKTYP